MAAVIRLTSVEASSTPNPVVRLTSVAASAVPSSKVVRLTYVAANAPANSSVVRLTSVEAGVGFEHLPPVANAGGDQQLSAAQHVTLPGSETSDVPIVSRSWRQALKTVGAPDLELDSLTIATPSFTAPILTAGATYILGYTVTDEDGLQAEEDMVQVNVAPADLAVATVSGWVSAGILAATSGGWV